MGLYIGLILTFPLLLVLFPLCFPCFLLICLSKEIRKKSERIMACVVCCCCFVVLCPVFDTALVLWVDAMILRAFKRR